MTAHISAVCQPFHSPHSALPVAHEAADRLACKRGSLLLGRRLIELLDHVHDLLFSVVLRSLSALLRAHLRLHVRENSCHVRMWLLQLHELTWRGLTDRGGEGERRTDARRLNERPSSEFWNLPPVASRAPCKCSVIVRVSGANFGATEPCTKWEETHECVSCAVTRLSVACRARVHE